MTMMMMMMMVVVVVLMVTMPMVVVVLIGMKITTTTTSHALQYPHIICFAIVRVSLVCAAFARLVDLNRKRVVLDGLTELERQRVGA
jgi:hypothetical protein